MAGVVALVVVQRADRLLAELLREADDVGPRRAQFIGHVMDELLAQPRDALQSVVSLGQRPLDIHAGRDIREGDQRRSIRQRRGGAVEHRAVASLHVAAIILARIAHAGDGAADLGPDGVIREKRTAERDDLVDMRGRGGALGRELPELGESRVGELEAPVRTEHGNALTQRIQRLALGARERVEARFQGEALGLVVEEIGDAALRIGAGDDMDGAPIRQIPPILAGARRGIGGVHLGLPGAIVAELGQTTLSAQAIEDLAIARARVEEARIERPERLIAAVAVDQALRGVEDGDAGLQPVEGAHMRIHLALQVGADRLKLAHIGGDAGIARGRRRLHDVDDAALAGHDDGRALLEDAAVLARLGSRLALGAVEQIESGRDRLLAVRSLDGAGIGGVDPAQAAVGGAHPDRLRHAGEQGRQRCMIAGELAEFVLQRQCTGALAADLAQADHGATGDRAALGVDIAPSLGLEGEGEGLAALLESFGRQLETLGFGRGRPGSVCQCRGGTADAEEAAVTLDDGARLRPIPAQHDLTIRRQQGAEPFLMAACRLQPSCELALTSRPARTLADIEDRGGGGEDDEADEDQRKAAGAEPIGPQRQQHLGLGESGGRHCAGEPGQEEADRSIRLPSGLPCPSHSRVRPVSGQSSGRNRWVAANATTGHGSL